VDIPTTDYMKTLQDVKVEVMVWFMSQYDIMHEHVVHSEAWPPLPAEKYPYLLLRFYDTYPYYIYI